MHCGQHFFYGGYYRDLFNTMFVLVLLSTLWTLIHFESWDCFIQSFIQVSLYQRKKKTCDVPVNKNMNGCCKSTRPTYALCGIETGVWTEHTWSLKVLHSAEISNIKHFSRHILVKTYLQVKNWTDVIVTISTSLQYILIPSCYRSTKKELQLKTYRNKNGLLSCSVLFSAIMLANADWMLYYFCWCPTRTLFKCKWVNKYRFLFPDLFH